MVLCLGALKAQLAVVLVLKPLRGWGNGLMSHPIDLEKPGREPAIWFTRHRFIPYTSVASQYILKVLLVLHTP